MRSLFLFLIFGFVACQNPQPVKVKSGIWRANISTAGGDLPFGLEITANADSSTYTVYALNGAERLQMDSAAVWGDSLIIPMGLFDAVLIAKVENEKMVGIWQKKRSDGSFIEAPFSANFAETHRFFKNPTTTEKLSGKWQTVFTSASDTTQAVGVFEQKGTNITGTFLTPTGDYRYLAGDVQGDSLFLSCYDGTHAFLFTAKLSADKQSLAGKFWSNGKSLENWTAKRNANATLPDAHSLTFLKTGYESLDFSFPDLEGKAVSLKDERFKNKVVIVQIMGSWCPNCMDETKFLAPWYQKNQKKGVEIIGLAFEKNTDLAVAAPKLEKMKKRFGVGYTVLLAGKNDKAVASAALPALSKVIGFPTTIFIDRKGKVRKIHTGFSGPGTGKYYDKFLEEFDAITTKLINEK